MDFESQGGKRKEGVWGLTPNPSEKREELSM